MATSPLTREQLVARLEALRASGDPTGSIVRVALQAVGIQALGLIRAAFIVKARGGVDAAGIQWKPLTERYVAYGRRHPGLAAKRKKATAAGRGSRPLLTAKQDALWRSTYARALRWFKGDKGHAAAYAWVIVKAAGGQTILGKYGRAPVEIGRDTGRLFASLSPGAPDNILDVQVGTALAMVGVGTNVSYSAFFHARRPIWPDSDKWPAAWTDRVLETVGDAVAKMIAAAVK